VGESSLLKLTQVWQKAIAAELWRSQTQLSELEQHRVIVQSITLVLCLYFCERQHLLSAGQLQAICATPDPDQQLLRLWQTCCGPATDTSRWFNSARLKLPASLLQSIIDSLFYPTVDQFAETPVEVLGRVYESTLRNHRPTMPIAANAAEKSTATTFKKLSGIYYTPQPIVQSMVQSAFAYLPTVDSPRVLDPACGGGAFLLAAYQALYERQLQAYLNDGCLSNSFGLQHDGSQPGQLPPFEQQRLLSLLYGVDLDPQAVMITQLSLWLKVQEYSSNQSILFRFNPNIRCGNALIDTDTNQGNTSSHFTSPASRLRPFHWQTHFPKVFQAGGFDLVVGNPPYVDAEWMTTHLPDWRTYCTAHYQTASGNWDLFCVFIERALQLCRPEGITSLIVPNKLFSADYAHATRRLLSQYQMLAITDYSNVSVFAASVYPIVYLLQKKLSDSSHAVQYTQMVTPDQVESTGFIILPAPITPAAPWSLAVSTHTSLFQRLADLPKLTDWVTVSGAATVAEAYLLKSLIRNRPVPQSKDLLLVNSGTIDRYRLLWGQKRLRYLGQTYLHPVVSQTDLEDFSHRRCTQAMQSKIIVAGMSRELECVLDSTGTILAGKSTVIMQAKANAAQSIDLRYVLALLNSRFMSWYFQVCFRGNQLQGGYFRIGPTQLRQLPIVIPNLEQQQDQQIYQRLIQLVNQKIELMRMVESHLDQQTLNEVIQTIDKQINDQIHQLYHLSDRDIQTLVADADSTGSTTR
jgi:N-6 DNA Methylase/TaqI-like C-terminal specificity domain